MFSTAKVCLLAGAFGGFLSQVQVAAQAPPVYQAPFFSRPDLNPPAFTWAIYNEALVTPGYMLLTPYTAPPNSALALSPQSIPAALAAILASQTGGCSLTTLELLLATQIQNGPYIYDSKGNLVYSGYGETGGMLSHDVKVSEYQGRSVMTYFQGNDRQGGNRGHGVIMDDTYKVIASVQTGLGRAPADVHEFTVLPGGTALTTIFQPTPYSLVEFGVNQPVGWVIDGVFQEIDIESGEVLFEWRALDHVPLNETYNGLKANPGAGYGNTTAQAWDYFHLNSIDKDTDGNYIISSRHCSTIYKINGNDGSIIWRLNGKSNDFTFVGFNNTFSFQHQPRILSRNGTTTVLSLFDNGSDGYNTTSAYSSAMIVAVDTATMVCTLLRQYHNPVVTLSTSQGSTQVLDNSNVFVGWGSVPQVSEFTADGKCVMLGGFGVVNQASSYRAVKTSNWVGKPDSTPAIWTYANSTSLPTTFYVSWNGATQVASWKFFARNGSSNSFVSVGSAMKVGFETSFTASQFYEYGYAEAIDANGHVLEKSSTIKTFVPYSAPVIAQNTTVPSNTTLKYRKRW